MKLDNSYVHNLIHGFILAGEHLVPGGSAPGQAYFDNYFSTAKAERDLGYRPLYTTEAAMADCLPYYTDLYATMKGASLPVPSPA